MRTGSAAPFGVEAFTLPRMIAAGGRLMDALHPLPRPQVGQRRHDPSTTLGRIGSLEARLATSAEDIRAAQMLRYKVFFEEMGATPDAVTRLTRRDCDRFDRFAEHIIVIDHDAVDAGLFGRSRPKVVGTYRVMTQTRAKAAGGFYSADEFEIGDLVARRPDLRFLELGRSCVLPEWRSKRSLELLWTAIWSYCRRNRIDALFGCASFPGADASAHAPALDWLARTAMAPADWRASALPQHHIPMLGEGDGIDGRQALALLPPLIKGYLRVGAYVGDGAVADPAFGTTDVLMILPVARIGERYLKHFG